MSSPKNNPEGPPGRPVSLPAHLLPPESDSAPGRILAAARTLFAERGLAATSTRAIAHRADVNLALIHYHFGNKEKLYRRAIEQEVIDLQRLLGEFFEPDASPAEILPKMPRVAMHLHRDHPHLVQVMLRELADGGPHLSEILDELGDFGPRGLRRLLLELIGQAQQSGWARDYDPAHVIAILLSMGNGLAAFAPLLQELLSLDVKEPETRQAIIETAERFIRRALAPDRSTADQED